MKNNFLIKCSLCEEVIDLYDENNFTDELLNNSDTTYFDCPNCDAELLITTNVIYSFTAKLIEDE